MAGQWHGRTIRDLLALMVAFTVAGMVIVGVTGSDDVATAATTTTHRLTIPAAAFHPSSSSSLHLNSGGQIRGNGWYVAQIPFHRPGSRVQVMNMTMFAKDNDSTLENDACAQLFRTVPADGSEELMTQVCTQGESAGVRAFQVSVPKPRNITEYQGGFVRLSIYGNTDDLLFYGVRLTYRVTQ